jgi:hypothetical protein
MLGISWLAEKLLAAQEGLCSMELSSLKTLVSLYKVACTLILTRSSAKMKIIWGRFWSLPSTLEISNKTHHHLPDILILNKTRHHSKCSRSREELHLSAWHDVSIGSIRPSFSTVRAYLLDLLTSDVFIQLSDDTYKLLVRTRLPSRLNVSDTVQSWKYEAMLCSGDNTNSNKNCVGCIIPISVTLRICRIPLYNRITSTKSPSPCMTTFRAKLTKLTILLPQSHDCTCYVSMQQHTMTFPHAKSRTLPNCDVSLGLHTLPAPEAGGTVESIKKKVKLSHYRPG